MNRTRRFAPPSETRSLQVFFVCVLAVGAAMVFARWLDPGAMILSAPLIVGGGILGSEHPRHKSLAWLLLAGGSLGLATCAAVPIAGADWYLWADAVRWDALYGVVLGLPAALLLDARRERKLAQFSLFAVGGAVAASATDMAVTLHLSAAGPVAPPMPTFAAATLTGPAAFVLALDALIVLLGRPGTPALAARSVSIAAGLCYATSSLASWSVYSSWLASGPALNSPNLVIPQKPEWISWTWTLGLLLSAAALSMAAFQVYLRPNLINHTPPTIDPSPDQTPPGTHAQPAETTIPCPRCRGVLAARAQSETTCKDCGLRMRWRAWNVECFTCGQPIWNRPNRTCPGCERAF